jgi:hypothetical protein
MYAYIHAMAGNDGRHRQQDPQARRRLTFIPTSYTQLHARARARTHTHTQLAAQHTHNSLYYQLGKGQYILCRG